MYRRIVVNNTLIVILISTFITAHNTGSWSVGLNALMNNCSPSFSGQQRYSFFDSIRSCLQRRTLGAVDRLLEDDVIPVFNGIELVRFQDGVNSSSSSTTHVDTNRTNSARDSGKTWRERIFGRFSKIFRTHVLKIDVDRLTGVINPISDATDVNTKDAVVEGRRRHHRRGKNQMMSIMMMGLLLMGTVLIPMGFQFLAVLGGKALLLAKLALMLSSIQGLKKIATNGVNYGLYHAPITDGWHERSQQEQLSPYEMPYPYQRV